MRLQRVRDERRKRRENETETERRLEWRRNIDFFVACRIRNAEYWIGNTEVSHFTYFYVYKHNPKLQLQLQSSNEENSYTFLFRNLRTKKKERKNEWMNEWKRINHFIPLLSTIYILHCVIGKSSKDQRPNSKDRARIILQPRQNVWCKGSIFNSWPLRLFTQLGLAWLGLALLLVADAFEDFLRLHKHLNIFISKHYAEEKMKWNGIQKRPGRKRRKQRKNTFFSRMTDGYKNENKNENDLI